MIKAVLFDFDDTLVKTKEIRYKALKFAGKKFFNFDITDNEIDQYWGKPFNAFLSGLFKNIESPEALTEKYKSTLHEFPNEPYTGTIEVLENLSKKYLLGIVSSSNPDLILSGMENTGIDPKLFFFIQSSYDTDIHKPDPRVFLPCIEKLKIKAIKKSETLYVGDALDDFESSSKAGIHFCGIANRTVSEDVFKKEKYTLYN